MEDLNPTDDPFIFLTNETEMLLDKSKIFNVVDRSTRKTKIICSLGPSTTEDVIIKLIEAGMDVARISYCKFDSIKFSHVRFRKILRDACKKTKNSGLGLMFTTLGPQLLVGRIQNKEVKLIKDSYLVITTNYDLIGNENIISCNYNKLCESAQVGGELIFVNDIDIYCQITDINKNEDRIKVKIVNSGILKENSIIYLPFADIKIPTITSEDEESIVKFVLKEAFDMIVVSFVRSFTDLEDTRDILGPRGTHIKIIAKIDNYLGIKNYEEILNHSDGIMIARGRLCYEMPEEKLIQFQKYMIVKAKLAGKPVITSTQMLDSMVDNSRPTLAEVTDVANAVLEGSDAVLLTHETSIGKYPLESFKMMVKICVEAEQCIHYKKSFELSRAPILEEKLIKKVMSKQEAICNVGIRTAEEISASLIIVITETGSTARLLAKSRPKQGILALCMSSGTIRQLKITRGVIPLKIPSFSGSENLISQSILFAKDKGFIKKGDKIVCILGENEETPDYASMMKITIVL